MSDIEIQTKTGISVIERVDSSPARTAKTALARLETVMDRFQDIETDRMPSKTFLSLATVAMMKNSKLLQCNFASVLQCLLQCHAWGLDPTGKNNGAFLIAYRDECQLQLGYGALIDLATRDGTVTDIDAQIVYDHDKFEVEMGTNPSIIHEPDFKASRRGRGDGVAYYAVATFAAGHKKFVVLTRPEVEDIKKRFSRDTPAWKQSFDQMALKTVIHRLVKTLPMNMMATQAIAHSERADFKLDEAIDDTPVLTEAEKARVRELQGVQVPPEPEKAPEPPPNDGSEEGLDGWLESQ